MTGSLCSRQETLCPPPSCLLNLNSFLLAPSPSMPRICTHINLEATQACVGKFSHFFLRLFVLFRLWYYQLLKQDSGWCWKGCILWCGQPSATRLYLQPSQEQATVLNKLDQSLTIQFTGHENLGLWLPSSGAQIFTPYLYSHYLINHGRINWHREWEWYLKQNKYLH